MLRKTRDEIQLFRETTIEQFQSRPPDANDLKPPEAELCNCDGGINCAQYLAKHARTFILYSHLLS